MGEIITRKQVAEMFNMPVGTINYLVRTKQIPFSRLGKRSVRFDAERLKEWFHEREGFGYRQNRKADG
jgi:excisionase family DNA binding protein